MDVGRHVADEVAQARHDLVSARDAVQVLEDDGERPVVCVEPRDGGVDGGQGFGERVAEAVLVQDAGKPGIRRCERASQVEPEPFDRAVFGASGVPGHGRLPLVGRPREHRRRLAVPGRSDEQGEARLQRARKLGGRARPFDGRTPLQRDSYLRREQNAPEGRGSPTIAHTARPPLACPAAACAVANVSRQTSTVYQRAVGGAGSGWPGWPGCDASSQDVPVHVQDIWGEPRLARGGSLHLKTARCMQKCFKCATGCR